LSIWGPLRDQIQGLGVKDGYYTAKTTPEIVDVERGYFLTIEGRGAPEGEEFQSKIGALYALAYGIKMLMKKVNSKACGGWIPTDIIWKSP